MILYILIPANTITLIRNLLGEELVVNCLLNILRIYRERNDFGHTNTNKTKYDDCHFNQGANKVFLRELQLKLYECWFGTIRRRR